jgi:hypothetical protein
MESPGGVAGVTGGRTLASTALPLSELNAGLLAAAKLGKRKLVSLALDHGAAIGYASDSKGES